MEYILLIALNGAPAAFQTNLTYEECVRAGNTVMTRNIIFNPQLVTKWTVTTYECTNKRAPAN